MADFIPTPEQADDAVDSMYGAQSTTLRQSVMAGQAMAPNPDVAAKALPLAQDNKIPLDMAVRNQPDLQKQKQFNDIPYEQLVKQYPQISKFMSDPENAAIAHDDVGALSTVSGWAKSFINDHYDMQAIGSTLGGMAQNLAASATHMAGESYHGLFQAAENAGANLDNYLAGQHPGLDPVDEFLLKSAAPALHDIGMVGSEAGKQVSDTGTAMDNANQGLLPGISRMVGGMGGAALNPLGMTAGFTTGMAGEGFDEAKKQGFDENSPQANATAALNAAMGFVMSKMGPEVLAKGIPAALQAKVTNGIAGLMAQAGVNPSGLAARLGYRAADATMRALSDAVAMGGQTVAGNAINQDVLGEKGDLTQGMGDTLEQGGVLGLVAGLIFHHANMNFQPAMNEYRTQTLDAGRQFVADTKLQQRSPEKMNELLRSELGDRDVFINPGAAQTFYQSLKPEDRANLDKSMPDFGQHIAESQRTGEDLQIDQADYHTYIQQLEGSKNLDQWVKWVPDGTSEGDEKARADFVKNLYSDYADAKDKGDPIQEEIYRQLIQRHGERAAVSGSPDIARLLSQNPADFHRTMLSREGEGARPVLDQFIGSLRFARQYPALDQVRKGGADAQDLFIDKVRGDKAGAAEKVEKAKGAEFDQATGEKKKGYSPRGERAPTPVMDYLKGLGGVKKGSLAANDLIEAGLTRGQLQRLYSEKGIKGLDNLPVREFNDAVEEHGLEGKALPTNEGDTDAHYLDPEWLKGELSKEASGKGAKNKDQASHDAATEDMLHVLDVMGIDFDKASNKQIKDALQAYSDSFGKTTGERFYQGGAGEGNRGMISFPEEGSPLIHLFEKENLSTVLHEYGHLYWHTLDALGKLDTASPQIKADINAVREWVGAEGADKLTVEQEEKIADGFLTYLRDNEAPSAEVRSSFQRFKSWLSRIYQGARDTLPSITPHVKEVFDRMFATDDEIQRMRDEPVFEMDPRLSQFLTEAQKATAQRKLDRMVGEASERLFRKAMKQSEEKGTDEYKAAREAVSAETQERISQEPRYQALAQALEKGLDRKKAIAAYGEYGKEAMEYLKQHRGLFKKDGVNPEVVAALHGFNSARDMLDAFQKMEPRKDYAARLTDEEMVARHGDMLKDGTIEREAVNAYHNGMRAQMLEWEMKQLAALAKVPTPGGQQIAIKAKQIINDRLMSEIIPSRFYRAEVTAARKSGEAVGKKNFEAAAIAKAQQLLNHHLYQEALAARDLRDDNISKWKKKLFKADDKLAKTMDMDFVQAARAILGAHGIGSGKFDFDKWFAHLSADDPETYNTMREIIESANLGTAKPIKDMTFGEFQGLSDNINSLIMVGTDSKTIMVAGKRLEKRLVIQELTDQQANMKGSGLATGMAGKISDKDLNKKGLLGLMGYLRRVENLCTAYDGYRMDGPHRKYIFDPIKAASEAYRDARDKALKEVYALLEPHIDNLMNSGKISAPELVSDKTGEHYVFDNKAELVGMLQHIGNGYEPGSNGYGLLRGYGWSPEALQQFRDRCEKTGILTKEDYDLTQKVWDMYDGHKDAIWKAHREMKGYYPSEITAVPFKTSFGEYKGGYAPKIADRNKSSAIEEKELKNQITNEDNNFAFPTTGRGATMQRTLHAAYPLEMSLRNLDKHIDWAMKYTHIEPVIKQVAKIMFDREFKDSMDRINPATVPDVLIPWMQRSARQSMNMTRDKNNALLNKGAAFIRRNSQLQALGLNPIYAAQRIGSIGPIILKSGRHVVPALVDLVVNHSSMKAQIKEESAVMRHRNNTADENIQAKMGRMLEERSAREKVRDWATDHGFIVQHLTHQFLDLLQYTAGKYKAQAGEADGVDPSDDAAVQKYAEHSVEFTQGSFHPENASRIEASGNPWTRLATVFYGIMNTQGNMLYDHAQKIIKSDASLGSKGMSAIYLYAMGYAVPSMVASSVMAGLKGGTPQGEDPEKFWLETLLGSQFSYAMGMAPILRDIASPAINYWEGKPYNDQVSLTGGVGDFLKTVFIDTPGDLWNYVKHDKDGQKVLNDLISDVGYAGQVPVTPIRRAVNYAVGVHKGTQKANNAGQVIRGVIGGTEPKK